MERSISMRFLLASSLASVAAAAKDGDPVPPARRALRSDPWLVPPSEIGAEAGDSKPAPNKKPPKIPIVPPSQIQDTVAGGGSVAGGAAEFFPQDPEPDPPSLPCACSPRSFRVKLDFANDCGVDDLEPNAGILDTACVVFDSEGRALPPSDSLDARPEFVDEVIFVEWDRNDVVINDVREARGRGYADGASIRLTSVADSLDPDEHLKDQLERVPAAAAVILAGRDTHGDGAVFYAGWEYDQDHCRSGSTSHSESGETSDDDGNDRVIGADDELASIVFEDVEDALGEFCPRNDGIPTPEDPTIFPTLSPTGEGCPEETITIDITTDKYPHSTSWTLKNRCTGTLVARRYRGYYTQKYKTYPTEEFCVPAAEYRFTIGDYYGNGMCCSNGEGGYAVTYDGETYEGGDFDHWETRIFGSCDTPTMYPTLFPTQYPTVPDDVDTEAPTLQPTIQPTLAPSLSPTLSPTLAPTDLSCPDKKITIDITTDKYPGETSWVLWDECTETVVARRVRGYYDEKFETFPTEEICVEAAKFKFRIGDSYGDGMCCSNGEGGYKVRYDGETVAEGGDFDDDEITYFGSCPTDEPTLAPTLFPTQFPTQSPTVPDEPTLAPTLFPTQFPTVEPDGDKRLVTAGNNGSPSNAFPLGECEGDCDSELECAGDLVCFLRDGTESVPGCAGVGVPGYDYCIPRPSNYLAFVFESGVPQSALPLGPCDGDCDTDDHCDDGLVCFHRSGKEEVPGCVGEGLRGKDYCVRELVDVGQDHSPLGLCEGDCDDDDDCESGLACFKRDDFDAVPGCVGKGKDNWDYCVREEDD